MRPPRIRTEFHIILELDGDKWLAYCPELVEKGASAWGDTRQEAFKSLFDALQMIVTAMDEHGV